MQQYKPTVCKINLNAKPFNKPQSKKPKSKQIIKTSSKNLIDQPQFHNDQVVLLQNEQFQSQFLNDKTGIQNCQVQLQNYQAFESMKLKNAHQAQILNHYYDNDNEALKILDQADCEDEFEFEDIDDEAEGPGPAAFNFKDSS